jgi:tetratricopeptide (TPR) repeat protein
MNESNRALRDAVNLEIQGRDAEATTQYLRAIRLNPHNLKAYDRYSQFLFSKGRSRDGVKVMRHGLRSNPGNLQLRAFLGMHLYRLGKVSEAYKELKAGIKQVKRYDVQVVFAQCAFLLEDFLFVVSALESYLRSRPGNLQDKDYVFRRQLGVALMRMGSLNKAERVLRKVRTEHPRYLRAKIALGEILLLRGRCADARQAFEKLLSSSKNDELLLYIGASQLCLRKHKLARSAADRFLARREGDLGRLLSLRPGRYRFKRRVRNILKGLRIRGDASMRLKHHREALKDYRTMEHLAGGTAEVVLRVAHVLFQMKEVKKALQILVKEMRKPDTLQEVVVLALRASIRVGEKSTALRCAERLLKQKAPTANHLYYAGMAYSSAGKFKQATQYLARALSINPKHSWARKELVRAYRFQARREFRRKNNLAALEQLKRAERLAPSSATVQRDLTIVFLRQGKGTIALSYAKKMLALAPNSPIARRLVGRSLAIQGRHKEALAAYRVVRKGLWFTGGDQRVKAQLLTEEGIAMIHTGLYKQGMAKLQQAIALLEQAGARTDLARVKETLVRAQIHHAHVLLDQGSTKRAKRILQRLAHSASTLPQQELAVVQTLVVLATALEGDVDETKLLIKRHEDQLKLGLRPPYDGIGPVMLEALAESSSHSTRARARAAARLGKLAQTAQPLAMERLRRLAGDTYYQLAFRLYRHGGLVMAKKMLARARRLIPTAAPVRRHNSAIVDYYTGEKEAALRAIVASAKQVPMASCNLGVHYHRTGDKQTALLMFSQCDKRGVRIFPNLKQILETMRQIYGRRAKRAP